MTSWPHAPPHRLEQEGIYMITAGTYGKSHYFQEEIRLQLLHDCLLSTVKAYGWILHAWAVFSNHYHFIAQSPKESSNLSVCLAQIHQQTASTINKWDATLNRRVWYQFWDSKIDKHTSYMARLNYVHRNAVKHGLVGNPANYPWCSAAHFENHSNRSFVKSVYSFDMDKVKVFDDF